MKKEKIIQAARSKAFGIFEDAECDFIFRRTLEYMGVGAAEIGECLYVARRINTKDGESWISEWTNLAHRVEEQGDLSLEKGNVVSARESYLRASNYYRNAEYSTPPNDPRFDSLWKLSQMAFHKACPLFEPEIKIIEVPFEGTMLPGYFWQPDSTGTKRPTLFSIGGNDSSGEEVFFANGFSAVQHGYNFFTFEFPGHRGAIHVNRDMIKRANYEEPFKNAFDLLVQLPGVDERIGLTGFSFGGYVSSQVATREKRVTALIPNSPIIDSYSVTMAFWGGIMKKIPLKWIAKLTELKMKDKPVIKAFKDYTDLTGGVYQTKMSIQEKFDHNIDFLKSMNIVGDLDKITCPVLALVSDGDGKILIDQANQFIKGVSSKDKTLYQFSLAKDGSDEHCQLDNRSRGNQVMFDWLNRIFSYTN